MPEKNEREAKCHVMKILPEYFLEVCGGRKNFEIRVDDRDVQVGDTVILREWDPKRGYTGYVTRELRVSYVLRGVPEHGLTLGYCIFSWDN